MLNRVKVSLAAVTFLAFSLNACVSDDETAVDEVVNVEGEVDATLDAAEPPIDESVDQTLTDPAFDLNSSTVYFGYDEYTVNPDSHGALDAVANYLKADSSLVITLEGHCDVRGSTEYNLALGERRAQAVKDYLLTLGVAENQLSSISYGEEKPASLGTSESDHSQNRRVQFTN